MAKKGNKDHHGKGVTQNINLAENMNSFNLRRDTRLNQQHNADQNLSQNAEEGNANYAQMQRELAEATVEYNVEETDDLS